MTLRHSLAQGDLLGTTGLVASSGPAAQNLCHLTFWGTGGIFPVQSQTLGNSSAGAGVALLMAQSKPAEVEAPEGCLGWGDPTHSMEELLPDQARAPGRNSRTPTALG